jgi:hypothetical protein
MCVDIPALLESVADLLDAVERASDLTARLLAVGQQQELERRACSSRSTPGSSSRWCSTWS